MKKKATAIGTVLGIIFGTAIIAYAVTSLFFTRSETSNLSKKTVFQFDLSTGMQAAEIGPGDSITVNPSVYNDSTEDMYVFIVVNQPTVSGESLYSYTITDGWKCVSSTAEKQIYAYASENMTLVIPGDTTDALTDQMTMANISYAEYSQINDINFTITAYGIGTEDIPTDPETAWEYCKQIGHI